MRVCKASPLGWSPTKVIRHTSAVCKQLFQKVPRLDDQDRFQGNTVGFPNQLPPFLVQAKIRSYLNIPCHDVVDDILYV